MSKSQTIALIRRAVLKWPERIKAAGKSQKALCQEAEMNEGNLSRIMNLKIRRPHLTTVEKVEQILEKWGV